MSPKFAFTALQVRRAPGFAEAGFRVEQLSPGVNIVFGPNASGKSTFARAIRRLLWPQEAALPQEIRATSLIGELLVDGQNRTIEFDAGYVRHQCEGADADPPLISPADSRDRYLLALHELLSDENRGFAQQIARESAGGYDLRAASEALNFRPQIPKTSKELTALRQCSASLRQAHAEQFELQQRYDTLTELERRREEADATLRMADLVKQALRFTETQTRAAAARSRLEEFPPSMSRLRGDERERLGRFQTRLERAAEQLRDAQRQSEQARLRRDACGLGESGLPAGTIARLRTLFDELETAEAERARQTNERSRARCLADDARAWFGDESSGAPLSELDPSALEELLKLARRLEDHRARYAAARAERDRLVPDRDAGDPDVLRTGLDHLHRWLAAADGPDVDQSPLRWIATAAGAVVLLMSLLAAGIHHLAWLLGAFVGAAFVAVAWLWKGPERAGHRVEEDVVEFQRLGLGAPSSWSSEAVRTFAAELARRWSRARLEAERALRRRELEPELTRLAQEQQALAASRTQLFARWQLAEQDELIASVWVDHLIRWQRAHAEVRALTAAIDTLEQDTAERRSLLAQELATFGYEVRQRADAGGAIDHLSGRHDQFQQAAAAFREAAATTESNQGELERAQREYREWLAGLGLEDECELVPLIERYDAYVAACEECRLAETARDLADAALAAEPGLKDRTPHELAAELSRAGEAAEQARQLSEEIGRIRQEVEAAKKKSDVEQLLAQETTLADELREQRQRVGRAIVGDLLAAQVSRQSRERDRPAVFRRARQLFSKITHGRYQLELDDGEPPCFRAIDTSNGLGRALDELSSGTRLQLLLAVRVAFVESQEQGPKLPLLLDETLGNSDERRASEIIDAALTICREGRQLFYFTAQVDEVRKWREVLAAAGDVPHQVLDLAACRDFSEAERLGRLDPLPAPTVELPSAEGVDHARYGKLLEVPAFDYRQPANAAHVWYVCDDPLAVHDLLELGINNWGQLETLHRLGGPRPAVRNFDFARAEAAARALDRMAELRRVGQGKRVDRAALLESGAETKFFDDMVALSEQVQGDARALLAALEGKAIRGFRGATLGVLREHFLAAGYLDERTTLTRDEIRLETLSAVMHDLNEGRISPARIDQLLSFVDPPANAAPDDGADTNSKPRSKPNGTSSKSGRVAVDSSIGDTLF
ncbi:MAG: AAA family ATPase [Pirellulales bacterium]|nr:AAA family ATPase [Pirellulales bacterium]